jgi:uncharacterized membrane protein
VIALTAALAVVVSLISLYRHYGTSETAFCNFGNSFNCDIANRSAYSTALGLPVALIGVLDNAFISAVATIYGDLTYVEKFVLDAWCVLCVTSLGLVSTIAVMSTKLAATARRH